MNLRSCDKCGVVLDLDKIEIPPLYSTVDDEEMDIMTESAQWDGDKWIVTIDCPVCKWRIPCTPQCV